jgi:hypothetical protein
MALFLYNIQEYHEPTFALGRGATLLISFMFYFTDIEEHTMVMMFV